MTGLSPVQREVDRAPASRSYAGQVLRRLGRDRIAVAAGAVVLAVVAVAVLAPALSAHNPDILFSNGLTASGMPLGPSKMFLLGTDQYGRDELSRLLWGSRTALFISVAASALASFLGLVLGLIGGYVGGVWDEAIGRVTDVVMSFPVTLFAIATVMVLRPTPFTLTVVIGFIFWTYVARLVRAEVLILREAEFVQAARALGAGTARILSRHLMPHVLSTVIVRFSLGVAQTLLMEAGLSFLGAGVQPPTPDWGLMVAQSESFYQTAPSLVIYPGAAILLTALAFNLLGEGLRTALDPTQAGVGA